MNDLNSTDYYRGRERHARALAAAAVNPTIANIHLEMAAHYAELLKGSAPVLVLVRYEAARERC